MMCSSSIDGMERSFRRQGCWGQIKHSLLGEGAALGVGEQRAGGAAPAAAPRRQLVDRRGGGGACREEVVQQAAPLTVERGAQPAGQGAGRR